MTERASHDDILDGGGVDPYFAFDPSQVLMGGMRRGSHANLHGNFTIVELPELAGDSEPVPGSLQNPHIVDPSDIPGTAPRGAGADAKGYFRYPKQHGEASV